MRADYGRLILAYAHRDDIYDADTHMMERPDWIAEFADPNIRGELPPFVKDRAEVMERVDDALARFNTRTSEASIAAAADDDFMSMQFKGWHGLGAFDAAERSRANDLLGFKQYIVFPTPAFDQINDTNDQRIWLGGVTALNRGLATFCAEDKRMLGTAYIPLGAGPEIAVRYVHEAVQQGFAVVLIDTIPPVGGQSFTHPDYDPVWTAITEAELAVVLHIGATGGPYQPVPDEFYNNGKPVPPPSASDAPPDALKYMGLQYNAEIFLAAMIFDGVLERFPTLKIGIVELGASWIISWMKHLDQAFRAFRRLQDLSQVKLLPSEYVRRQMKITPFAGEDIGWLLTAGAEDLLMFASDYPHHEGTDDPIGRYERTMQNLPDAVADKFYKENFKALLGKHAI